ncbi:MAG: glycogen synthase GlgA [Candidatus Bipolaricaulis sp.]|nr:glycogen synthase GlgA [Candidatus Bipolaricaulis sp.]
MRVLFVSAEVAPYAKVGGLGDVAAALPRALADLGVEIAVAIPKYRMVTERARDLTPVATFPVAVGGEVRTCQAFRGSLPQSEVPLYALGCDPLFDRPGIYGEGGGGYPDELERFAFLSRAALDLGPASGWLPDLVHANDWHTALIPVYLRAGLAAPARSLLTIHNLAYQGSFPRARGENLGLNSVGWQLVTRGDQINLLQGGIRAADWITTVSPSYAREILAQGEGLEEVLHERRNRLTGILNGIDTVLWDPSSDPHLWAPYSAADPSGKYENKRSLQAALGLSPADDPLVAMVSRLAEQKGFDLVLAAFERMMALGIQFVVLGEGDPRYASFFRNAERRYGGRVRALIQFSEAWAHRIEAGADLFLMPSRFEPAGLNQLYSLRYGTVPVVRATGGLNDTIHDYDPGTDSGNGFTFTDYTAEAMLSALGRAVRLWCSDREAWRRLMVRGMGEDHSWAVPARQYCALYERVLAGETPRLTEP